MQRGVTESIAVTIWWILYQNYSKIAARIKGIGVATGMVAILGECGLRGLSKSGNKYSMDHPNVILQQFLNNCLNINY